MKLLTISFASLAASVLLLLFTLWVSEAVAKATTLRTEIALNQ
jgi:hypothetical protein